MTEYPLYILDLDGTLFRGDEPIPGAAEAVSTWRARGSQIRFLTNNSTQVQATYVEKLRNMGFQADPSEVYTSALGAAEYLRGSAEHALVIGEQGLMSALLGASIQVAASPGDPCDAVVVGLHRHFTYELLTQALQRLIDPRVRFIATNRDATYPLEGGRVIPGAGAIVAAIAYCSGREPEVVGKPNPFLIEWILRDTGIAGEDTLVVGDRMDTDIEAGRRAGCHVHLVLSGVTGEAPAATPFSLSIADLIA